MSREKKRDLNDPKVLFERPLTRDEMNEIMRDMMKERHQRLTENAADALAKQRRMSLSAAKQTPSILSSMFSSVYSLFPAFSSWRRNGAASHTDLAAEAEKTAASPPPKKGR